MILICSINGTLTSCTCCYMIITMNQCLYGQFWGYLTYKVSGMLLVRNSSYRRATRFDRRSNPFQINTGWNSAVNTSKYQARNA